MGLRVAEDAALVLPRAVTYVNPTEAGANVCFYTDDANVQPKDFWISKETWQMNGSPRKIKVTIQIQCIACGSPVISNNQCMSCGRPVGCTTPRCHCDPEIGCNCG